MVFNGSGGCAGDRPCDNNVKKDTPDEPLRAPSAQDPGSGGKLSQFAVGIDPRAYLSDDWVGRLPYDS